MATQRGRVILVVLGVATAVSLWRTAALERQKGHLSQAYTEAQDVLGQVTQERDRLNGELSTTRQTMEAQVGQLASLQHELEEAGGRLERTVAELASLQREQAQLRSQNSSLSMRLSAVTAEKAELEQRLSSLKELKLAIRDVQRKIWQSRWASLRARIEQRRREDQDRLVSGNRGYLIRDGKSTVSSAARLQVHVLEPQSQ